MIPKIIHYCWFGEKPLSEMAKKCIESWKKYCPDYEIKEWNESNFDVDAFTYAREAYQAKKWAFVTDVVRLYALVNCGGIYMDTDVEVIKPLDPILTYKAVSGFEWNNMVPTGLMASEKEQPMLIELLEDYNNRHFIDSEGKLDLTTNVDRITEICLRYGLVCDGSLQTINGFTFLPSDYLCPKNNSTRKITLTNNTLTIHHFDGSWVGEEEKYLAMLRSFAPRSRVWAHMMTYITKLKYDGVIKANEQTVRWIMEHLEIKKKK